MTSNLEHDLGQLKHGDHVCLIYETAGERLAVIAAFIKHGLARAERCICIDDRANEEIIQALGAAGVDAERERRRGAVRLLTSRETYLRSGAFVPQEMIDFIRQAQTEALADGFSGLRMAGEMTWALGPAPGCDRWIEFEALLNRFLSNSKCVALGLYDRARFDALCIHDVFRTQPVVILGNQFCPNPYYESPEMVLSKDQAQTTPEFKEKRVDWWIAQLKRGRRDVTERRRMEELLEENRRRFQAVFENALDPMVLFDDNARYVDANPATCKLLGYSREELLKMTVWDVTQVEERQRVEQWLKSLLSDGTQTGEIALVCKSGALRQIEYRSVANILPGLHLCAHRDITDIKRALEQLTQSELELRENQQLLHMVLTTLPVGVMVTDRAANVILANPAAKGIWGETIVSGRERWAQSKGYWHESGRRIEPESWASARALREGQTSLNELIDIETFDGQQKTIQNSAAPIRSSEGVIVGAVIVNEDVTERVRAQKALRESADRLQHLSRRLLAVQEDERRHLARELHDEVGQLLTSLQLLLDPTGDLQTGAVIARFEQARAIVHDLLAKVRGLSFDLRPAVLDQLGLMPALSELFENYAKQTGVQVSFKHKNGEGRFAPEVETTAYRIVQEALTNVARHAGVPGVTVRVWATQDRLSVQIEDRGRGFDAEAVLASARSSGLGGMRERVMLLGGELTIDSRPGGGTQITADLPLGRSGEQT